MATEVFPMPSRHQRLLVTGLEVVLHFTTHTGQLRYGVVVQALDGTKITHGRKV